MITTTTGRLETVSPNVVQRQTAASSCMSDLPSRSRFAAIRATHPVADHSWLPFSRWNLRYNPFGELLPAERARVAIFDVTPVAAALGEPTTAIQFIGQCGRGKTTRLLALQHHLALPPQSAICLPPWSWAIPAWWAKTLRIAGSTLMIDEAQRMPPPVRRAIFHRRGSLVLGTHRDFSKQLRRAGYRVLTYEVGRGNDAEHVAQVANARLGAARLTAAKIPQVSIEDASWLVSRFGDDLRAIESFLYHQVQKQVDSDGEMRFID
jgi:hypothetical protein